MTVFPSIEYIEKAGDGDVFEGFSYLTTPNDFSGYIFFHNLEGDFVIRDMNL